MDECITGWEMEGWMYNRMRDGWMNIKEDERWKHECIRGWEMKGWMYDRMRDKNINIKEKMYMNGWIIKEEMNVKGWFTEWKN